MELICNEICKIYIIIKVAIAGEKRVSKNDNRSSTLFFNLVENLSQNRQEIISWYKQEDGFTENDQFLRLEG